MKIILASTSPRRKQFLTEIGFTFQTQKPLCDELEKKGESPSRMVKRLSQEKAHDVYEQLKKKKPDSYLIIAADTTVVSPTGKGVLGKPRTPKEANAMLKKISGKTHQVFTAFTILSIQNSRLKKSHTRSVKTSVQMRSLNTTQIKKYVSSGEPMDKAGAYGAQGIGMCLIQSIRGSYSNVVGLPMAELVQDLEKLFEITPEWSRRNKQK